MHSTVASLICIIRCRFSSQSINTSFASVVSGGGNGERMNGTSPSSAGGHQDKGKARKRLQQQQQQQANDAPPQQANANNKITPLTQEQLQQVRKQPLSIQIPTLIFKLLLPGVRAPLAHRRRVCRPPPPRLHREPQQQTGVKEDRRKRRRNPEEETKTRKEALFLSPTLYVHMNYRSKSTYFTKKRKRKRKERRGRHCPNQLATLHVVLAVVT